MYSQDDKLNRYITTTQPGRYRTYQGKVLETSRFLSEMVRDMVSFFFLYKFPSCFLLDGGMLWYIHRHLSRCLYLNLFLPFFRL